MTTASTQLDMPSSAYWLMDRSAATLRLSCATLTCPRHRYTHTHRHMIVMEVDVGASVVCVAV